MNQFRVIVTSIAVASTLVIGGCAAGPDATPTATATPTPSASIDPWGPAPEYFPKGTASQNKPLFDWALGQAVLQDMKDPGKAMVKALAKVGFDKETMQVTKSKTGTGGPADAVTVSVRFGKMCLIGQRFLNWSYYSSVEAVMSTGTCLIGQTREITW